VDEQVSKTMERLMRHVSRLTDDYGQLQAQHWEVLRENAELKKRVRELEGK